MKPLNDNDIDKLEAGAELDALVAQLIMGWRWPGYTTANYPMPKAKLEWSPSTDIAAAWQVVEKLKPHTWNIGEFEYFECSILLEAVPPVPEAENPEDSAARMFANPRFRYHQGRSPTNAALAICRAALKAVASC